MRFLCLPVHLEPEQAFLWSSALPKLLFRRLFRNGPFGFAFDLYSSRHCMVFLPLPCLSTCAKPNTSVPCAVGEPLARITSGASVSCKQGSSGGLRKRAELDRRRCARSLTESVSVRSGDGLYQTR